MKYPIKGIPTDKIMKDVTIDEYRLEVSYLDGKTWTFSRREHELVRENYMKQLYYFTVGNDRFDSSLYFAKVPFLITTVGAIGFSVNPTISLIGAGGGLAVSIFAGILKSSDYRESKIKHQIVRDHLEAFYAEYDAIRKQLGQVGYLKIEEPEDVVFAIDDMPKKLILEVSGADERNYKLLSPYYSTL